jgi:methylmalonyl-CoA mutase cobalamin-binding subunit
MANAESIFKKLGFDRVYMPGTVPNKVIQDFTEDMDRKRKGQK